MLMARVSPDQLFEPVIADVDVGIGKNEERAGRTLDADVARCMRQEAARTSNEHDGRKSLADDVASRIIRTAVDDDRLEITIGLASDCFETAPDRRLRAIRG